MMKNNKKIVEKNQICFVILTVMWMIIIFFYSSQPAIDSKEISSKYAIFVCEHLLPFYDDLSINEQITCLQKTDHIIRKIAHFAEYAILGFFVVGIFISKETKGKKLARVIIISWLITALYATSDEFHQLFVPGRSGQVSDVIIDSSGALVGILLCYMVIKFFVRRGNVDE